MNMICALRIFPNENVTNKIFCRRKDEILFPEKITIRNVPNESSDSVHCDKRIPGKIGIKICY